MQRQASRHIGDLAARFLARRQASATQLGRPLVSHFPSLDAAIGSLADHPLILIAGRPSMGKSALLLNILLNVTQEEGLPALLFTIDMSEGQVALALLAMTSGIESHLVRNGCLDSAQQDELTAAADRLKDVPLYVESHWAGDPDEALTRIRVAQNEHGLRLCGIDSLSHLLPRSRPPVDDVVRSIMMDMRKFSLEVRLPLLGTWGLREAPSWRESHYPEPSDLHCAEQLQGIVDLALLLHRPEYYDRDDQPGVAEVIAASNGNGLRARATLSFDRTRLRFVDSEWASVVW